MLMSVPERVRMAKDCMSSVMSGTPQHASLRDGSCSIDPALMAALQGRGASRLPPLGPGPALSHSPFCPHRASLRSPALLGPAMPRRRSSLLPHICWHRLLPSHPSAPTFGHLRLPPCRAPEHPALPALSATLFSPSILGSDPLLWDSTKHSSAPAPRCSAAKPPSEPQKHESRAPS